MKPSILFAPESFWKLPLNKRMQGRCGPGKGLGDLLVSETLWGLPVTSACSIHDYMYRVGKTIEDKEVADRAFLNNMMRIIESNTKNSILKWLRKRRAITYYNAVKYCGGMAFWKDKNKPEELGIS